MAEGNERGQNKEPKHPPKREDLKRRIPLDEHYAPLPVPPPKPPPEKKR